MLKNASLLAIVAVHTAEITRRLKLLHMTWVEVYLVRGHTAADYHADAAESTVNELRRRGVSLP